LPETLRVVETSFAERPAVQPGVVSDKFAEMCVNAEKMAHAHNKAADWCRLQKNIHTYVALVAGIIASSALFGLVGNIAPETVKFIGAVLALLSAYCAAFNVYWKFPERESNHSNAVKRLTAFANSCRFVLNEYEYDVVDKKEFRILLQYHERDYAIIVNESPKVSIKS